jgi:hypothetical protein
MGIPKHMAVAVSGLIFAGGAVLAAAPAYAQVMAGTPQHSTSGGNVLGGGGGGGGGGPVVHRRVVVHRPIVRERRVRPFCVSCRSHENFREFGEFSHREHRRAIIVNRNRNFSESDTDQFQRQRDHQEFPQMPMNNN